MEAEDVTVRTRRVHDVADAVDVYEKLDAGALLQPLDRGWPEEVVGVEAVDGLRLGPDEPEPWRRIDDWIPDAADVDTAAGAYGYVGYDVCRRDEHLPESAERDLDVPDVALDLYDTVVVFEDGSATVEAVEHPEQEAPPDERAEALAQRVRDVEPVDRTEEPEATYLESSFGRDGYERAVRKVKQEIRRGETFQANISQRLTFESDAEAVDLYRALRRTNPSPYMALWEDDDHAVVSSSPELLLEKQGDAVRTRPIAGTRPRGEGEVDEELRRELEASEKERAEHSILVDLERNDLGKVAEPGTVEVTEFMETVPYSEVHHLESTVEARAPEASSVEALHAVFPGGTVTGAPKPRTLEIIEEVEPVRRGPYTGSLGCFRWNGDACFNILIRTLVKEDETLHLQVGGGVVHDSDPAAEYRETLHKARAVADALGADVDRLEDASSRETGEVETR